MKKFYNITRVLNWFIIFICVLFVSCNKESLSEIEKKDELVHKLIDDSVLESIKTNGKIIVLRDDYCKNNDCEKIFACHDDQFILYSIDEIFMRGISKYIDIEDIDKNRGELSFVVVTKDLKQLKIVD